MYHIKTIFATYKSIILELEEFKYIPKTEDEFLETLQDNTKETYLSFYNIYRISKQEYDKMIEKIIKKFPPSDQENGYEWVKVHSKLILALILPFKIKIKSIKKKLYKTFFNEEELLKGFKLIEDIEKQFAPLLEKGQFWNWG